MLKFDDVIELVSAATTEAQNRSLEEKDSNKKRKKEHSLGSKEKVNQTKVKKFRRFDGIFALAGVFINVILYHPPPAAVVLRVHGARAPSFRVRICAPLARCF